MIIGLTGPQRAGKTTVYDHFHNKHNFVRLSIAAQIKKEAHRLVGMEFTDAEKDEPQPTLNGATPRDLYIYIGQLDEYYFPLWVERMFRDEYQGPGTNHVIESVGKPFQWAAIMGFAHQNHDHCVIFDVSRPDYEYKDSRSPILDYHNMMRVENKRGLDDLYRELDDFYLPALLKMKFDRTDEEIRAYIERIKNAKG